MPKSAKKNKHTLYFLFYLSALFILLLTALNFNKYFEGQRVLGIEVKADGESEGLSKEKEFWEEFLSKNPNYIPGWIELGNLEKVKQIDPNYFLGL